MHSGFLLAQRILLCKLPPRHIRLKIDKKVPELPTLMRDLPERHTLHQLQERLLFVPKQLMLRHMPHNPSVLLQVQFAMPGMPATMQRLPKFANRVPGMFVILLLPK